MQRKYLSSLQRNDTDVSFSFIATGCELAGTTKILYNEQNSYRTGQLFFLQRIKQKKRIFLSWKFNERQRSTNDTNLAGYFFTTKLFF